MQGHAGPCGEGRSRQRGEQLEFGEPTRTLRVAGVTGTSRAAAGAAPTCRVVGSIAPVLSVLPTAVLEGITGSVGRTGRRAGDEWRLANIRGAGPRHSGSREPWAKRMMPYGQADRLIVVTPAKQRH